VRVSAPTQRTRDGGYSLLPREHPDAESNDILSGVLPNSRKCSPVARADVPEPAIEPGANVPETATGDARRKSEMCPNLPETARLCQLGGTQRGLQNKPTGK
jgi:hypothetical protein